MLLTSVANPSSVSSAVGLVLGRLPNENQDFVEEKFKELDSDQIEGGEFEFLGLEIRFERNKRFRIWRSIFYFGIKIDF